jgi:hypothetical protein
MEQLNENILKDLFSKVKDFLSSDGKSDDYKEDPKHLLFHEIISKLSMSLQELVQYLSNEMNKMKASEKDYPDNKFNKMESVNDNIRSILGSLKEYKLETKNNSLADKLYKIVVEPLHSVNKETPVIEYEKILIDIIQKLIKIGNFYQDDFSDDEHSEREKIKNIFMYFPTDNFEILNGIASGRLRTKDYMNLDVEYKKRLKAIFDKNMTKTTDVDAKKDSYASEWSEDSPEQKFRFYVDDKKNEDFDNLWDSTFKAKWKEQYKKEAEAERQRLSHLKESIQYKILETFIKE